MGLFLQQGGRGTMIVLVAPSDVFGGDRGPVVKLNPGAELKGRALAVFSEVELLGKRQMVVSLLAKILRRFADSCG